jgi:biotin carboxylase
VLVLSGIFKGDRFIKQCHKRGAKVTLLTTEKHTDDPWPRECIENFVTQPIRAPIEHCLNTVSYLARATKFDLIEPMDDYDVEVAAALRDHLRIPGMGASQARYFRDKLAMRMKAKEGGLNVPDFCPVQNYDEMREFMARVPAPWMFKPRSEASASGIKKLHDSEQMWRLLDQLGDRQSHFLMERYVPGDIYHVDCLVSEGKVVFAEVHRCGAPPFDVTHSGGVWRTRTVERGGEDEKKLRAFNEKVMATLGHFRGVSHTEFIKAKDGQFYFLETAARVGGAYISDLVEASTGINLWEEWANLEVDRGQVPYVLPKKREDYGGVIITLAKQQFPDLSGYNDPEVVYQPKKDYHAALILRGKSAKRVDEVVESYAGRFLNDFMTAAPAREGRAD